MSILLLLASAFSTIYLLRQAGKVDAEDQKKLEESLTKSKQERKF